MIIDYVANAVGYVAEGIGTSKICGLFFTDANFFYCQSITYLYRVYCLAYCDYDLLHPQSDSGNLVWIVIVIDVALFRYHRNATQSAVNQVDCCGYPAHFRLLYTVYLLLRLELSKSNYAQNFKDVCNCNTPDFPCKASILTINSIAEPHFY